MFWGFSSSGRGTSGTKKVKAHLKEKISFERKHVNPGEFAYNQFSDQLRVDFCDKGRPPTKKIVYFRALPESGGGRPHSGPILNFK